jgi:hypothetical protein
MKQIGQDYTQIQDCVNRSFKGSDHTKADNDILSKENEYWKSNGPHFFPAVVINNVTYRGYLNPGKFSTKLTELKFQFFLREKYFF